MSLPEFHSIEIEVALFKGSPTNGGSELDYEGYNRAQFGESAVALYNAVWGVVNKNIIEFPKTEEPWEVTHVALMARHYDVLISCGPVTDVVVFLDGVSSALEASETKIVPAGHGIVLGSGALFIAGGIVSEVLDFNNQSKMIS